MAPDIAERMTRLETIIEERAKRDDERWLAHDKRSQENWAGLREMFDEIKGFMRGTGERKKQCMDEAKTFAERHTSKIVGIWLGIPVTATAIIFAVIEIGKLIPHGSR